MLSNRSILYPVSSVANIKTVQVGLVLGEACQENSVVYDSMVQFD